MSKHSAGILFFRFRQKTLELLLVHPGGPFWKKKDLGAWSIPKGEVEEGEDPVVTAKREVGEELNIDLSSIVAENTETWMELQPVKQKSGKIVHAWAIQKDLDTSKLSSNEFEMEWPPRSGKKQAFPEIDKAEWFMVDEARSKIIPAQSALIDELLLLLGRSANPR